MVNAVATAAHHAIMSRRHLRPRPRARVPRMAATIACVTFLMSGASVVYAEKDVVITTSGDRLVGEIKKVEKDVLTLETDYSDSDFKIKWEKIASIESDRQFLVETFDGKRVAGSLKPDPQKTAALQVAGTAMQLPEVSDVQPFERTFWSRLDASLDFGYSLTQANSAKQLTLAGNLTYRDERNLDTLFANVFRSSQEDAPETSRWDLANDFRHLLGSRWYVNTAQEFLNSEEQSLKLRTTLGGGGGRYLLRSSSQYLALGGGLAWNNEKYTDPEVPTKNSAEAYLGTEFMTERLKFADLLTRLTYYPSLTIGGRYRINYNFDLDFNLPGDWYFRIGFFENFDSKPPTDLSKNDYGWSNGFGLKF